MAVLQQNGDEIAQRGEELYQQQIRTEVETPENIGKMVIIDVETGEYAVDDNGLVSARYLHAQRPNAPLYGIALVIKPPKRSAVCWSVPPHDERQCR